VLADIKGPGVITHLWMAQPNHYRECLLKITWDDAKYPSVLVPLRIGDESGDTLPIQTKAASQPPHSINSLSVRKAFGGNPDFHGLRVSQRIMISCPLSFRDTPVCAPRDRKPVAL